MVNLQNLSYANFGEKVSAAICFLFLVTVSLYPVWLQTFLRSDVEELQDPETRRRYGVAYEDLKFAKNPTSIYVPCVSLMRLMVLGLTVTFVGNSQYFQIFSLNFQLTGMVIFVN